MTAHQHTAHTSASLTDAAREFLTSRGEKWTETRAAVFETLASFDRPASIYDIAGRMTEERRRIPANSVYRILDLLVTHDIVKRVESANAYVPNAHPGCFHDCIFLVCDQCRAIEHIDDDAFARRLRSAASANGFVPRRPVIEVHGLCGSCAGSGPDQEVSRDRLTSQSDR